MKPDPPMQSLQLGCLDVMIHIKLLFRLYAYHEKIHHLEQRGNNKIDVLIDIHWYYNLLSFGLVKRPRWQAPRWPCYFDLMPSWCRWTHLRRCITCVTTRVMHPNQVKTIYVLRANKNKGKHIIARFGA